MKFILSLMVLLASSTCAFGQWSFSELANRLSLENSKLVSYRLFIRQHPKENGGRILNCTWIHEFSQVGEYEAVAHIVRDKDDNIESWSLRGRTGDTAVAGGGDAKKGKIGSRTLSPNDEFAIPKFLDWRLAGFSFCGDIGSRFETVAKNIAAWDKIEQSDTYFKTTKAGVFIHHGQVEIEVEIKDGTRVTSFRNGFEELKGKDKDRTEWKVEYAKKYQLILPSKATLTCGDQEANLDFIWASVNEPLDLAPKAIMERFSKEIHNSVVVDY